MNAYIQRNTKGHCHTIPQPNNPGLKDQDPTPRLLNLIYYLGALTPVVSPSLAMERIVQPVL